MVKQEVPGQDRPVPAHLCSGLRRTRRRFPFHREPSAALMKAKWPPPPAVPRFLSRGCPKAGKEHRDQEVGILNSQQPGRAERIALAHSRQHSCRPCCEGACPPPNARTRTRTRTKQAGRERLTGPRYLSLPLATVICMNEDWAQFVPGREQSGK